jgi:hypothetical protein
MNDEQKQLKTIPDSKGVGLEILSHKQYIQLYHFKHFNYIW